MNILEELFYGNISVNGTNIEVGSKQHRQYEKADEIQEKLLACLNEKEKNLFLDYVNIQSSIQGFLSENNFISGFKLGVLLMSETFHGAQEIHLE